MRGEQLLPKVRAPQVQYIHQRPRLHSALDNVLAHAVTWVGAQAGAGKTTAVADFLKSRHLHSAWLNLDREDNDPATFFYYLGMAIAKALPRNRLRFPQFDVSFRCKPQAYARLFFRYLSTRVKNRLLVVLDNVQELTDASLQSIVLSTEELSSQIHLLLLSRTAPPDWYARTMANQIGILIDHKMLCFTLDETRELMKSRVDLNDAEIEALWRRTEGWAAGLVLLREYAARDEITSSPMLDYVANEIFAKTETSLQRLLLRTAFLPVLPATVVKKLTNDPMAPTRLESLCRRNLLVHRLYSDTPVYQAHPILREYLRHRAERDLSTSERNSLSAKSGQLLLEAGYFVEALPLLIASGCYQQAVEILVSRGKEFCISGQYQQLRDWIEALPHDVADAYPQLSFWLGEAYLGVDAAKAHRYLREAAKKFADQGDLAGHILAMATLIESAFYGWAHFPDLAECVAWLKLHDQFYLLPVPDDRLRVLTAYMLASQILNEHDYHNACEQLARLIHNVTNVNQIIESATVLLSYFHLNFARQQARDLIAYISPFLNRTEISPFRKTFWLCGVALTLAVREDKARESEQYLIEAERCAEQSGLPDLLVLIKIQRTHNAIYRQDLVAAQQAFNDAGRFLQPNHPYAATEYHRAGCRLALLQGASRNAVEHAKAAMGFVERFQHPEPLKVNYQMSLLGAYLLDEDYDSAQSVLKNMPAGLGAYGTVIECQHCLLKALACKDDKETVLKVLIRGLQIARDNHYWNFLASPILARQVCELALKHEIETEFVCAVAAKRQLITPCPDWDHWPWQARIRCLGKFAIEISGENVLAKRRTPVKVLELLWGLLAKGGREVPVESLINLLWPGEGRLGSHKAFEITLHRARKLLGDDAAITLKNQEVSFDPNLVWIDAWALVSSIEATAKSEDSMKTQKTATMLYALYRGHFLSDASQALRLQSKSEDVWSKVRRFLLRYGAVCSQNNDYAHAMEAYYFGIRHDPLANEFHYELMKTLIQTERYSEALNLYTTYRRSMRAMLNRDPAPELELLARSLARHSPAKL